jgi:glyoxylase-like metal-dependent hydrolase (beta-lactamase superfamily II)
MSLAFKRSIVGISVAALLVGGGAVAYFKRDSIMQSVLRQAIPLDYFEPEAAKPDRFERVAENVYAFRHGFNRTMVVDTGEGLAVFDTFNAGFARALRARLTRELPGRSVRWVIYSHNHLDHVRGAAELQPQEIIGHADINRLLADWPHLNDIVRVTRPVEGDTEIRLGSARIQMLFLPQSHSTTLYGFYLPEQKVVFAPDLMFVEAFPPFGLPDWYYPGYIRALDRLIALDADHYIPSHFEMGSRSDLLAYRNMMADFREVVVAGLARHNFEAADGATMRQVFDEAYPALHAKYGHWHGFEAMFVPHFGGQYGGTYLGY